MSVLQAVGGFAVVAGLLTLLPGLDTALVLRAAMTQGRRDAFLTALGIGSGALVWGVAAAVGVSALLTASTVAYTVLRVVGAAYMVWLGARLLVGALRRAPAPADTRAAEQAAGRSGWQAWRTGLLTNLLNPKIGAFYIAVLPPFIPDGASPLAMGLLLALVHDVLGLVWFALLILGVGRLRVALQRPRVQRTVDGVTGSVLVGFGLRLGLAGR
ncbi:LysE family translocator [Modestobacter sp. I12A-02628]|uniref:LysE family translocator n=1 Tax=Goekera deserti TaxID=2497753 RepID=A0A7K3WGX1_9ACTN|nr:LysE family translocator [Goekera deserti]MPQ99385.1 LysE family translocator [Goekera deserti]NDI48872.1 LysE family transporter [Goekera deserti]NEL55657.1 LysE family translocator [Goekera deserti]